MWFSPPHSAVPSFAFLWVALSLLLWWHVRWQFVSMQQKDVRFGVVLAVNLSLFFINLMVSSFLRPLLVVPYMQWHGYDPHHYQSHYISEGGPSPL